MIQDVAGRVDAAFRLSPQQMAEAEFLVRQKYRTKDPAFLSLKEEDLQLGRYPCGDFESHPYGKVRRAYGKVRRAYGKVRRDYQIDDAVLYGPR